MDILFLFLLLKEMLSDFTSEYVSCSFVLHDLNYVEVCNGHELGQTPGDGKGQGGLVYFSPQGPKELDMTGQLNNNNKILPLCPLSGEFLS